MGLALGIRSLGKQSKIYITKDLVNTIKGLILLHKITRWVVVVRPGLRSWNRWTMFGLDVEIANQNVDL